MVCVNKGRRRHHAPCRARLRYLARMQFAKIGSKEGSFVTRTRCVDNGCNPRRGWDRRSLSHRRRAPQDACLVHAASHGVCTESKQKPHSLTLSEEASVFKLPTSISEAQALGLVVNKYKDEYFFSVVVLYTATYILYVGVKRICGRCNNHTLNDCRVSSPSIAQIATFKQRVI